MKQEKIEKYKVERYLNNISVEVKDQLILLIALNKVNREFVLEQIEEFNKLYPPTFGGDSQ
jgi:hypothetical protein